MLKLQPRIFPSPRLPLSSYDSRKNACAFLPTFLLSECSRSFEYFSAVPHWYLINRRHVFPPPYTKTPSPPDKRLRLFHALLTETFVYLRGSSLLISAGLLSLNSSLLPKLTHFFPSTLSVPNSLVIPRASSCEPKLVVLVFLQPIVSALRDPPSMSYFPYYFC